MMALASFQFVDRGRLFWRQKWRWHIKDARRISWPRLSTGKSNRIGISRPVSFAYEKPLRIYRRIHKFWNFVNTTFTKAAASDGNRKTRQYLCNSLLHIVGHVGKHWLTDADWRRSIMAKCPEGGRARIDVGTYSLCQRRSIQASRVYNNIRALSGEKTLQL